MPSLEPKDRMTKRSLLLKRIWRWMNRGRKLKEKEGMDEQTSEVKKRVDEV